MTTIPFGDFRPDVADLNTQYARVALNVVPHSDGYAPFGYLFPYSSALGAKCFGAFQATRTNGTKATFAGTSSGLFLLDNTFLSWSDVSKGGGYSLPSSNYQWQFAQFNDIVIAVQPGNAPQAYTLSSSSVFADLAGSPPTAAYVAVVNRFLVLSGLASPNVTRIQWSGLDDVTNWTSGVNSSDFQDLPDGGVVRGIAGGEFGVIMQDTAIRRLTYQPGTPLVFSLERIAGGEGIFGPCTLTTAGDRIFYCSTQGFHMLLPGGYPTPIGKERVDKTILGSVSVTGSLTGELDTNYMRMFLGSYDPQSSKVMFSFRSNGSAAATDCFDTIYCYDWLLDRWSKAAITGEYMLPFATGAGAGTAQPILGIFDSSHKLNYRIKNAEATLETPEQGLPNSRMTIRGLRPLTDATAPFASVIYRDTQQASTTTTSESQPNTTTGLCPQLINTRYARAKVRIPIDNATFTYASGVEADFIPLGNR